MPRDKQTVQTRRMHALTNTLHGHDVPIRTLVVKPSHRYQRIQTRSHYVTSHDFILVQSTNIFFRLLKRHGSLLRD